MTCYGRDAINVEHITRRDAPCILPLLKIYPNIYQWLNHSRFYITTYKSRKLNTVFIPNGKFHFYLQKNSGYSTKSICIIRKIYHLITCWTTACCDPCTRTPSTCKPIFCLTPGSPAAIRFSFCFSSADLASAGLVAADDARSGGAHLLSPSEASSTKDRRLACIWPLSTTCR